MQFRFIITGTHSGNCYITITLGDERFEDLIQVITKTVGAALLSAAKVFYMRGRDVETLNFKTKDMS